MADNICACGAGAGYPHPVDCPRPLYRGTPDRFQAWEDERRELRAELAEKASTPGDWRTIPTPYLAAIVDQLERGEDLGAETAMVSGSPVAVTETVQTSAPQDPAPGAVVHYKDHRGIPVPVAVPAPTDVTRDVAIARIRLALRNRSGRAWSVKHGTGTASGWISVCAPPRRCTWSYRDSGRVDDQGRPVWDLVDTGARGGWMSAEDCAELTRLLGLERPVHGQGLSIPAGTDYRVEHVDRAEGRAPRVLGTPYWD